MSTRRIVAASLIVVPFLIFITLRLFPALDPMWDYRVFHFYIVSYASLVALVISVFVLAGIGAKGLQNVFATLSFVTIAGFFMFHAAATPGMVFAHSGHGIGLSARLSLFSGSIFLALSVSTINKSWQQAIERHWRLWGLLLVLFFVAYGVVITTQDAFVTYVESLDALGIVLAGLTILFLLYGAWRAWGLWYQQRGRLPMALIFSMSWLALAQISQLGTTWTGSWWLYHFLMLASFIMTMWALLLDYEEIWQFRATRYFTAISVLAGAPVLALLSEAAVRLSGSSAARSPMFIFGGLSLLLFFLILLIVVRRAEAILNERAQLLELEKQWRNDLTNLIIHDLKNPLSVVSTSVSLLLGGKLGQLTDIQRKTLDRAERGTNDTLTLISNLLDVEKLEAGAFKLNLVPTNLADLLQHSVESMMGLAEGSGVHLAVMSFDTLPQVQVDDALITRVLQNLMTNAIKFTPKQGEILVDAVRVPEQIVIRVTDSGQGVPVALREQIFEKFAQVPGTERRGAGLGLTFCRLAVEAHGGRIWVEDAPNTSGSRFSFSLPAPLLLRTDHS